jgi:hypothetical protein
VDWIKIDVEGAELDVLKGATKMLAANQNIAILIELHRSWLYEPILNLLRKYDFRLQVEHIYGGDNAICDLRAEVLFKVVRCPGKDPFQSQAGCVYRCH